MRIDHQEFILFFSIASLLLAMLLSFTEKSIKFKIIFSSLVGLVGFFVLAVSDDREKLREAISERQNEAGDIWLTMQNKKIKKWVLEMVVEGGALQANINSIMEGVYFEIENNYGHARTIRFSMDNSNVLMVGQAQVSVTKNIIDKSEIGNAEFKNCFSEGYDVEKHNLGKDSILVCSIAIEIEGMPETLSDLFESNKIEVYFNDVEGDLLGSDAKMQIAVLASFSDEQIHSPSTVNIMTPFYIASLGGSVTSVELNGETVEEVARRIFERSAGNSPKFPFMKISSLLQNVLFSVNVVALKDIRIFETHSRNFLPKDVINVFDLEVEEKYDISSVGQWCGFYEIDLCWNTFAIGNYAEQPN